jgi:hypothetical protein
MPIFEPDSGKHNKEPMMKCDDYEKSGHVYRSRLEVVKQHEFARSQTLLSGIELGIPNIQANINLLNSLSNARSLDKAFISPVFSECYVKLDGLMTREYNIAHVGTFSEHFGAKPEWLSRFRHEVATRMEAPLSELSITMRQINADPFINSPVEKTYGFYIQDKKGTDMQIATVRINLDDDKNKTLELQINCSPIIERQAPQKSNWADIIAAVTNNFSKAVEQTALDFPSINRATSLRSSVLGDNNENHVVIR